MAVSPLDLGAQARAIAELVDALDALNTRLDMQRQSLQAIDERLRVLEKKEAH